MVGAAKVKANCANRELIFTEKPSVNPRNSLFSALTEKWEHDKIFPHADVGELVVSLVLGSNARACRFESCHPHQIQEGEVKPLPLVFVLG